MKLLWMLLQLQNAFVVAADVSTANAFVVAVAVVVVAVAATNIVVVVCEVVAVAAPNRAVVFDAAVGFDFALIVLIFIPDPKVSSEILQI